MSLLAAFTNNVQQLQLFSKKDKLLLAVSGGIDSVVLCHLCKHAGYTFAVAHCNFKLRQAESERDEAFVTALAKAYSVPIYAQQFDTAAYAAANKLSIQVAARVLRYQYFDSILSAENIPYLLTAHHANDNVETVVMNFFKGTGINGLSGIAPKHKNIIRPLLFATRQQIVAYATEHNIEYVEDSSNSKNDYTRNVWRNEWLPNLTKIYPAYAANVLHNIERLADVAYLYNQSIAAIKSKLITIKSNEIHIPVLQLAKIKPLATVLYEIIKEYNFSTAQVQECNKLLTADTGKYICSATHRILKNRQWLIITSIAEQQLAHYFVIDTLPSKIVYGTNTLQLTTHNTIKHIDEGSDVANLHRAAVTLPLLLRKHKQGDYFYPLGMTKKKKLSKFFIDSKLSIVEKENVWVLEDATKKIIWVVGYRIDNRFKVNRGETDILKLSLYR